MPIGKLRGVLTYRHTPGYAGHVTFLRSESMMPKTTSLAVVMDPIAKIKFAKDSTLAMLLAAAARGWQLTYFEQSDLFLRDGVALGRGRDLQVFADSRKWFELGEPSVRRLGEFDCVFMRKDPPFDAHSSPTGRRACAT
jgi:glutathione synthase